MWLGQTEAALRAVFKRARDRAPSVILFDEIDSIAPSQFAAGAQHDVSIVAQLLVLLDGLESRGQVFALGTTNRPEHVDPALRRSGRLDQVIWMRLPDERGRAVIFGHYLRKLKLDARLDPERLASDLALAPGLYGADIAFLCHRAALLCVKDATTGLPRPRRWPSLDVTSSPPSRCSIRLPPACLRMRGLLLCRYFKGEPWMPHEL